MAILVLDNESSVAGGNVSVFGSTGHEDLTILSGAQVTLLAGFDKGGDTIRFSGNAADYDVVRDGSTVVFTDAAGTSVRVPVSSVATNEVIFADGTFDVGVVDGSVVIGDQVITTTPAAIEGGSAEPGGGDDGSIFNITVTAAADVVEGSGDLVFKFERPASEAGEAVTLNVATTGGTATAGQDYTPVSQQVTFGAGQTTQFVIVHVNDDVVREETETVTLQVTSADGSQTIATATGNILDSLGAEPPAQPQSFELTTGADTVDGGAGNDRISGVQDITLPGKVLSAADIIDGGDGVDTLILINDVSGTTTPQELADADLKNVQNVEALQTNYDDVTLGAQAAEAGIVSVDTSLNTTGGTELDISAAGLSTSLNVTMANNEEDHVITDLAIGGDTINTGVNDDGGSSLDYVEFANQTTGVSVSFDGAAVGDGVSPDAEGNLGVAVQSLDATGNPVGAVTYTDDEGVAFDNTAGITVHDGDTEIGTFGDVVLGTANDDFVSVGGYANGGMGDDTLVGGSGRDWLVGGDGDDTLAGLGGVDHLEGGAGDDYLYGGAGIDVMDGGEGSDTYVFDNGEFVVAETITDTGTGADDVDTLGVNSTSNLTDALFDGKNGFEALDASGMVLVTLGEKAEATGITQVELGSGGGVIGASLDAGTYTADLTVTGYGNVTTGSGDDSVAINWDSGANRTVDLGDGDDTISEDDYQAIRDGDVIEGGAGDDTLVLGMSGGLLAGVASGTYSRNYNTANMTGIETIAVQTGRDAVSDPDNGDEAGVAQSYAITVDAASVDAGGTLVVDGSALRAGIVTGLGADGILGTADDVENDETLVAIAFALGADQALVATGGAGDDILFGGAGDDVLTGGAGDDALISGAGKNTLDGGEGSDIYAFADGEFNADQALNDSGTGADDVDTVNVSSTTALTDDLFAGKSGIEVLDASVTLGGGAEVTLAANAQAAGINEVYSYDGDVDASAYTADLHVTGSGEIATGTGDDTVVSTGTGGGALLSVETGDGDDVVDLTGTVGDSDVDLGAGDDRVIGGNQVDGSDVLTGGAGTDTLELDNGGAGYRGIAFTSNFTGFEEITLAAGDDAEAVAGPANDVPGTGNSYGITLVNDNVEAGGTLTIDGSALRAEVVTGLGADNEIGGTGPDADFTLDETLFVDGRLVTDGSLDVTGGAGMDVFYGGAKDDALDGGAGDDYIEGGDGNDTITGGAGADTLIGDAGDDSIDGGDGDDTISGGAGNDIMHGGAGDDTFSVTVTEFNTERDEVYGDEGTNTLSIDGEAAFVDIADVGFNGRYHDVTHVLLSNGTFDWVAGSYSEGAGVEVIEIAAGSTANNVSLINFTHDGTTLIGADGNDNFVGSGFADIIHTGEGNNIVNAGAGNDEIHLDDDAVGGAQSVNAGAGDDTIYGGNNVDAADVINGGAGNDTLVLGYANDGVTNNQVIDFSGGTLINVETVQLTSGYDADTDAGWHDFTLTFGDANVGASGVLTVNAGDHGISHLTENAHIHAETFTAGHALHYTSTTEFGRDDIYGGAGNDVISTGGYGDQVAGGDGNDTIDVGVGADTVDGGAGRDTISLGADEDTDTVNIAATGDSARATYDTVSGFVIDDDEAAGIQGSSYDQINFFGQTVGADTGAIVDGVVQDDSALYDAIQSSTSVLAAVQLVEQELNVDLLDNNNGVIAFEYHGNTYIGNVNDPMGGNPASFSDIVELTGVTGAQELVDLGGGNLGLSA